MQRLKSDLGAKFPEFGPLPVPFNQRGSAANLASAGARTRPLAAKTHRQPGSVLTVQIPFGFMRYQWLAGGAASLERTYLRLNSLINKENTGNSSDLRLA